MRGIVLSIIRGQRCYAAPERPSSCVAAPGDTPPGLGRCGCPSARCEPSRTARGRKRTLGVGQHPGDVCLLNVSGGPTCACIWPATHVSSDASFSSPPWFVDWSETVRPQQKPPVSFDSAALEFPPERVDAILATCRLPVPKLRAFAWRFRSLEVGLCSCTRSYFRLGSRAWPRSTSLCTESASRLPRWPTDPFTSFPRLGVWREFARVGLRRAAVTVLVDTLHGCRTLCPLLAGAMQVGRSATCSRHRLGIGEWDLSAPARLQWEYGREHAEQVMHLSSWVGL